MLTIDPSVLDDTQLAALAMIDPTAVRAERARRGAFVSMSEGLTALVRASFVLQQELDAGRQTRATKSLKESGILQIIDRLVATARQEGIEVSMPELS